MCKNDCDDTSCSSDCNACCDCSEYCEKYVLKVGDKITDLELEAWDPQKSDYISLSLAELNKKNKCIVLVFFPAAFTPVCPTELADIANYYKSLKELGAEVISVSEDTKFVQKAWQQSEPLLSKVEFPMASDPTNVAAKLFGIYDSQTGLALRGTFIINNKGMLASSEISYYNVARSANELLRKVEANLYVAEHPEEVCPANWQKARE